MVSNILTHLKETRIKCWKINFSVLLMLKMLRFPAKNDTLLVVFAQSFTYEKSKFLLKIPLFSVDV